VLVHYDSVAMNRPVSVFPFTSILLLHCHCAARWSLSKLNGCLQRNRLYVCILKLFILVNYQSRGEEEPWEELIKLHQCIEFHKPTTCTLYCTLKCSNYTPTCFERTNRFIFRESHNFTNHTHIQQYDHKTWLQFFKVHQLS
jgi:hypothetical protein